MACGPVANSIVLAMQLLSSAAGHTAYHNMHGVGAEQLSGVGSERFGGVMSTNMRFVAHA